MKRVLDLPYLHHGDKSVPGIERNNTTPYDPALPRKKGLYVSSGTEKGEHVRPVQKAQKLETR